MSLMGGFYFVECLCYLLTVSYTVRKSTRTREMSTFSL